MATLVYRFASENPWFWRWMYESSKSPISRSLFLSSGYAVSGQNIKKVFTRIKPDVIISLHPLCQHVPLQILSELNHQCPFVTIVTDLGGAHPTWFHPEANRVIVPSDIVYNVAMKEGIYENRIRKYGLPLRQAFWEESKKTREEMRLELNLIESYPSCLLVGGGEGVGNLSNALESIIKWAGKESNEVAEYIEEEHIGKRLQIIVVCGKNKKTMKQILKMLSNYGDIVTVENKDEHLQKNLSLTSSQLLRTISTAESEENLVHVHVVVYSYVDYMEHLMSACDLIVTKAGPGTIAEAATRALPIILHSYMPGQEEGNVKYVLEKGMGTFCDSMEYLGLIVREWVLNPAFECKMQKMRQRCKECSNPLASIHIAKDIVNILSV